MAWEEMDLWKGKPITELTHEECIQALKDMANIHKRTMQDYDKCWDLWLVRRKPVLPGWVFLLVGILIGLALVLIYSRKVL